MFKKLHYTMIIAIVVLLSLMIVGLLSARSYLIHYTIKKSYEQRALSLTTLIKDNVWSSYYPFIGYIYNLDHSTYKNLPQFKSLVAEMRPFSNIGEVIGLRMHLAKNKNILFSNHTSQIKLLHTDLDFTPTATAKSDLFAASKVTIDGVNYRKSILKVFTSLIIPKSGESAKQDEWASKASGVLEFEFDVTNTLKTIDLFLFTSFTIVLLSIGMVSLTYYYTHVRSVSITNEKQENFDKMIEDKKLLENQSVDKSKFIAKLSHELKTPLTSIIGFAEIIKDEAMGPIDKQYQEYAQNIYAAGRHLLSIANNLLDVSQSTAPKENIKASEMDFIRTVKEVIKIAQPLADQHHINFTYQLFVKHAVILGDKNRLKQIILNLMNNHIKNKAETSAYIEIKSWVEQDKNQIVFSLHSNSLGFSKEDLEKIMSSEINKQTKSITADVSLLLSKKIVEAMQGKFTVLANDQSHNTVLITFDLLEETVE